MMVFVAVVLTAAIVVMIFASNVFVTEFKPVSLTPKEQNALTIKLDRITGEAGRDKVPEKGDRADNGEILVPERYSEDEAKREIRLSEKELNALLAKNTDLAKKLAIDLSGNLVSAKYLLPLDEEFPVLGGKTLKITAGVELAFANAKPTVVVKGISIWGVPLPSAWIGGIKNIDLVEEYGDAGFWKGFADGVENLRIEKGNLVVKLKP